MASYDLETIRHSTAHLMAQAITRLWPDLNVQLGIGPVIDTGFYYDIDMSHTLTEEDLPKIEEMMKKIIKEGLEVKRGVFSKEEAIDYFSKKNQELKVDLINGFPEGEEISYYTQGEFLDLCRGPHVEKTSDLPMYFKLLSIAGAYWRGDSNNKMLQRVYAACYLDKQGLRDHLTFLEEAKKRDHRKLGKELDLFLFDKISPGSPFFLPKGAFVYNQLIEFMRRIYVKFNYSEVITPQILDSQLWHISGHYENYQENMFFTEVEEREFGVKPMNCPCHMLMFSHFKYSYRELPLRYADFGRLHRNEPSGSLAGITRVRTFCQDDAHIFLPEDMIQNEITSLMDMFFICYDHFGFKDVKLNLSTRPPKKVGDDAIWDRAEGALISALEKSGREFSIKEGDGAFYGPKIDLEISDAIKRFHQLGTIQLDFNLPILFDLKFTNQKGEEERPVVIHRALLGSLERFFGIYLEHVGGAYPFWLAPEQAIIVPVRNESHLEFSQRISRDLNSLGFRTRVDDRNESLGKKTRETQKSKVPFMLVIGDRELESNSVSLREYGAADSKTINLDELKEKFKILDEEKVPEKLR